MLCSFLKEAKLTGQSSKNCEKNGGIMDMFSEKKFSKERITESISNLQKVFWGIRSWMKEFLHITEEDLRNAGVYKGSEGPVDQSVSEYSKNQTNE